jgi:hypothetical protein
MEVIGGGQQSSCIVRHLEKSRDEHGLKFAHDLGLIHEAAVSRLDGRVASPFIGVEGTRDRSVELVRAHCRLVPG